MKGSDIISILVLSSIFAEFGSMFQLDGSSSSFMKFARWPSCRNASVTFVFATHRSNGLLLYFELGRKSNFCEVKLFRGAARLRCNLSLGKNNVIIMSSGNLSDGRKHEMSIYLDSEKFISLTVDNVVQTRPLSHLFNNFGDNGYLYVGGFPVSMLNQANVLALPSVVFETHFQGFMDGFYYTECNTKLDIMVPLESAKLRTNLIDFCSERDLCRNGGECINVDHGTLCDCSRTDFKGSFCETEKPSSEITLYGNEYLGYDLTSNGNSILSQIEEIHLQFQTNQHSGLLLYTGDGDDYLLVAIQDNALLFQVSLGFSMFESRILETPNDGRFNNNHWHRLLIKRDSREVSIQVDDNITRTGTLVGDFTMISSKVFFLGGVPSTNQLPNSVNLDSFIGCLKHVVYKADSFYLDIIDFAQQQSRGRFLTVHGMIEFNKCDDALTMQPITFLTEESSIELPVWPTSTPGGSTLQFRFQTCESNGLLMYSLGADGTSDFFGLEIFEGLLYLILDLGSGTLKIKAALHRVDDRRIHTVFLKVEGIKGMIQVDGREKPFAFAGYASETLDLESGLFVGGVGELGMHVQRFPPSVWSTFTASGFVGCFQDLTLNSVRMNLLAFAQDQETIGVIDHCEHHAVTFCSSYPCLHNGRCHEGWNRFKCDCSTTGYTGANCRIAATVVSFNGSQMFRVRLMNRERSLESSDLSFRFRSKSPNGFLLMTSSDLAADSISLVLIGGRVRMTINYVGGMQTMTSGQALDGNQWHTVLIKHRGHQVEMSVDDKTKSRAELPSGQHALSFSQIDVGRQFRSPANRRRIRRRRDVRHQELSSRRKSAADNPPGFVGDMQQLVFNRKELFELLRTGSSPDQQIETSAIFDRNDGGLKFPFSFLSPEAYLSTKIKIYSNFTIYFQMKTSQADSLIFYSGHPGKDFLAIELINGQVRFLYDVGSSTHVIRLNLKRPINDNRWHDVGVIHKTLTEYILKVDDTLKRESLSDVHSVHFDMDDVLYIGGVPKWMYSNFPRELKSRTGFQGCLASVDLGGTTLSIDDQKVEIRSEFQDQIQDRCEYPATECSITSCNNGGECKHVWDSYTCDCDMTSFIGSTCSEDSTAYLFGRDGGLITFTYPKIERTDTRTDRLAFGFVTSQRDGVLVRITSGNSNDYIQIELKDGNVFAVYNMGIMDHPNGELLEKVNDNNYHIVRFVRNGPNSTIQVDDLPERSKYPSGRQLTTFNQLDQVLIGGSRDTMGKLVKPYHGKISGLVINGLHVLEYAAYHDNRTSIAGDVTAVNKPYFNPVITQQKKPDYSDTSYNSTRLSSSKSSGCKKKGTCDSVVESVQSVQPELPSAFKNTKKSVHPHQNTSDVSSEISPCEAIDEDCGSSSSISNSSVLQVPLGSLNNAINGANNARKTSDLTNSLTTESHHKMIASTRKITPSSDAKQKAVTLLPALNGTTAGKGPMSVLEKDKKKAEVGSGGTNVWLIVGISLSILFVLIAVACAIYKFRSRDEGSYKIDESRNYGYEICNSKPMIHLNGKAKSGSSKSSKGVRKDLEWYV